MTRARLEAAINRAARVLARAAPVLLVAILGFVFLLTIVGPLCADTAPVVSRVIHRAFFLSCHQIPERCLAIGPGLAPVCARCQAIYAGTFVAALAALLVRHRPLPFFGLLAATLPIAVDGVSQIGGLRTSTTVLRLLTGGLWGLALGAFAIPLIRDGFAEAAADLDRAQGLRNSALPETPVRIETHAGAGSSQASSGQSSGAGAT